MKRLLRWCRRCLVGAGCIAVLYVGLALTSVPWKLCGWMTTAPDHGDPEWIVLLGGGGIPSESGLVRCYHAAEVAAMYPRARVIICMPRDGEDPAPDLMTQELAMRGVDLTRIRFEDRGRNTREQALGVAGRTGAPGYQPIITLVTSPEHMKRSLLSFRKAGFEKVGSSAAWDSGVSADLHYAPEDVGAKAIPPGARGMMIRYRFWDNLGLLIELTREAVAMGYYKAMGWI